MKRQLHHKVTNTHDKQKLWDIDPGKTVGVVIGRSRSFSTTLVYIDVHPVGWVEQLYSMQGVFSVWM